VNEDQVLVETRDRELLVTTLCREAMPLLRYGTRVACEIRNEPCECGRTGVILVPGERLDARVLVNETPLYPAQIEGVLGLTPAAKQVFSVEIGAERIRIRVVVSPEIFSDTMRSLEGLRQCIESEFLSRLGIPADVHFVEPARQGARPPDQAPGS
jgi:phenylacetate-CoA ligase